MYHSQYVNVFAGLNVRYLKEGERYSCTESPWEVLPSLSVTGAAMSAVEMENNVCALGGYNVRALDTVQKLSLDSLPWELMQLKLPQADCYFPCFKTDTQVIPAGDQRDPVVLHSSQNKGIQDSF
jgi:hypothetical protein